MFVHVSDPKQWCEENGINFEPLQYAVKVRTNLQKYLHKFGIAPSSNDSMDLLSRCLCEGFFHQVAVLSGSQYRLSRLLNQPTNFDVQLDPNSVIGKGARQPWLIYTNGNFIRLVLGYNTNFQFP